MYSKKRSAPASISQVFEWQTLCGLMPKRARVWRIGLMGSGFGRHCAIFALVKWRTLQWFSTFGKGICSMTCNTCKLFRPLSRLAAGRDDVGSCMHAPPTMVMVSADGQMAPIRPVVHKDEFCASHVHVSGVAVLS